MDEPNSCASCGYHRHWYLLTSPDSRINHWCERWQRETEPHWTCVSWRGKSQDKANEPNGVE